MSEKSLAQLSDELSIERDAIRVKSDELKELERAFREKTQKVLDRMKEEGTLKVTGERATISVSVSTVPAVKDWDKFYRYVKQHNAFHLLERRPASKAWREEVENRRGKLVPGTEGFEKRTLNLRKT